VDQPLAWTEGLCDRGRTSHKCSRLHVDAVLPNAYQSSLESLNPTDSLATDSWQASRTHRR
jgi:hypothetical protein